MSDAAAMANSSRRGVKRSAAWGTSIAEVSQVWPGWNGWTAGRSRTRLDGAVERRGRRREWGEGGVVGMGGGGEGGQGWWWRRCIALCCGVRRAVHFLVKLTCLKILICQCTVGIKMMRLLKSSKTRSRISAVLVTWLPVGSTRLHGWPCH